MVSTMIVHVIGIAALSSILVAVMIHTSMITNVMIRDNIKRVLEEAASSIALQVRYAINAKTNLTLSLDYPVLISKDRAYNIYIGTGKTIHNMFTWTNIPSDNNIYVFVIEPRSNVYVYEEICPQYYNNYKIMLTQDPAIIGSTIASVLRVEVLGYNITLSIEKGEVVLH